MSQTMNQLLKVALIKSAKFEYSEINLEGNSLLIGANGAGKTTFLRAILYFYTANAKTLGISNAKKTSFSDYYFEYENSYIAYVYKKDKKYILAIAYKMSSISIKLSMFDKEPNLKEIFVKNTDELLKPQELWQRLKEFGVLSNALKPSEYIKTLYGKTKQKEYALFFAKDYDGFIKTISNIFINSKVDSNTIKKVLVSSLDNDTTIDLGRLKRQLDKFSVTLKDIKSFEDNIGYIKDISNKLQELNQILEELRVSFSIVNHSKKITTNSIKDLENKLEKNEQKLKVQNESLSKVLKQKENKTSNLIEQIGIKKSKIKEIENLQTYYKKEQIEQKLKEYNTLPQLMAKLSEIKAQKEFLTKEQDELSKAHQNRLQELQNSYEKQKNDLSKSNLNNIQDMKDKETKLSKDELTKIQEISKLYTLKQDKLKDEKTLIQIELNDIQNSINTIEKSKYIFKLEQKLNKSIISSNTLENKTQNLKQDIQNLSKSLEEIERLAIQKEESIRIDFDKQIAQIQKQISRQKLLLSPNKNSLLHQVYDNNLQSNKYLYFLKDDVLDQEFDISLNSGANSIFDIEFKDFVAPSIDIDKKLKELNYTLEDVTKEYKIGLQNIKDQFIKDEKKILKEKNKINDELKEYQKELSLLKHKINKLEILKDEQNSIFNTKKEKELKTLISQKINLENSLKTFNEDLQQIQKEQNSKTTSIKIFYTKEKNSIKDKLKEIQLQFELTIKQLKDELNAQKTTQENNYIEKLKAKDLDIEKLKEYDKIINDSEQQITTIKSYERMIFKYEDDLKEFENLKLYKKELKEIQLELTNTKEEFEQQVEKLQDIIKQTQDKFFTLKTSLQNVKKEYDEFVEFEDSFIFNDAKNLIEYEDTDEHLSLNEIKTNIILSKDRHNDTKNSIEKLINKISKILDNSLEIKSENDTIKTATNIQEFYQLDKISRYKDLLGNSLNQIVKNLNDEYEKLNMQIVQIKKFISKINKLFNDIDISVIDDVELRYSKTNNKTIEILEQIKLLNDETISGFGLSLFSDGSETKKMIKLLEKLVFSINDTGLDSISLEDSFILEFRVIENGNDSKYQISLDNIGSNGTDVLVKSMIYIAMVHIFKSKLSNESLSTHVILDEIGILSQRYLKVLIDFANRYKILFVNGAPDEKLIGTYKQVYLIKREANFSTALEIVSRMDKQ